MAAWKVPRIWEGQRCFIFGGGASLLSQFDIPIDVKKKLQDRIILPSAYPEYFSKIKNERIIGINNSYQFGNWVDFLFFGDCSWYLAHRKKLAQYKGVKVTCCNRFANKKHEDSERIKYLGKDRTSRTGISRDVSKVAWNNNSGAAAISLAAHLGVKEIILLGFDMQKDKSGKSHWHGSHGRKNNPPFQRHLKNFPQIAQDAKRLGIKIYNSSPESKITVFQKNNLNDILN